MIPSSPFTPTTPLPPYGPIWGNQGNLYSGMRRPSNQFSMYGSGWGLQDGAQGGAVDQYGNPIGAGAGGWDPGPWGMPGPVSPPVGPMGGGQKMGPGWGLRPPEKMPGWQPVDSNPSRRPPGGWQMPGGHPGPDRMPGWMPGAPAPVAPSPIDSLYGSQGYLNYGRPNVQRF